MNSSVTKQGSVVDNLHVAEEQVDHLLGDEYEHESVPMGARRSAFSVTLVWLGFPMIITGAMTGSILVLGMGFSRALTAMIIGNLIMFAYVGLLGLIGTKRGMNFALIASIVFGKRATSSHPACCRACCSAGTRCRRESPALSSARPMA